MADVFPGADPWSEPQAASLVVVGRLRQEVNAAAAGAWLEVWLRQRFPPSDAAPVAARLDSLATLSLSTGPTASCSRSLCRRSVWCSGRVRQHHEPDAGARAGRQPDRPAGAWGQRAARQPIVESWCLPFRRPLWVSSSSSSRLVSFPQPSSRRFAGFFQVENVLVPIDPDVRVLAFRGGGTCPRCSSRSPYWTPRGLRLAQASRGEASHARGSRLRSGLATQIAACVPFLVGAGSLLAESSRLANPQVNLSYERVSLINVDLMVRASLATRLASDAAVQQVAVSSKPPLRWGRCRRSG